MMQPNKVMSTIMAAAAALVVVLALAGVASAEDGGGFVVTGRVYCDPCRAGFETNVSKSVPGACVLPALRNNIIQKLMLYIQYTYALRRDRSI
jgi:hypothetical protein